MKSMKRIPRRRVTLWLTLALCMLLGLCLCVGCGPVEDPADTTPDGTAAPTAAPTATPTDPATEAPATEAPATDAPATEAPGTEAPEETTEAPGWEADTGVFNEGVVDYEKTVETEIVAAFPDEKVGSLMATGDEGVIRTFHTDFSDNDPSADGAAALREAGCADCIDGVFYMPFSADSPTHTGGGWTTWAPNASSSVKEYKQAQLSVDWTVVSAGDGAWLNAVWGCYVSNYTFKIPDGPGDGLWLSFNPAGSCVNVYHPEQASWPAGFAKVPVADGLLNGKHHLDIVTTPDYSTYVYITAEGSDTARLVCTVLFRDGKICVYNEAKDMVAESACSTAPLGGDHYSLFVHGGGGAQIDEIALYAASKGETLENVTVTATPTEGNTLGLDITDKTDLVSICYSVWFDAILGGGTEKVTSYNNITEALAGNQPWGGMTAFHYWAKPAVGYYYRSSDTDVIRTHMTQLYTAGVDFIVIDFTNAGDGYIGASAWTTYVETPMVAILDTIMEMRAEGLGTPYVVFWSGDSKGPFYNALYEEFHAVEKWKDCFVYWEGKPFLITTHTSPDEFPLPELFTVRSMWGLGVDYDGGQWSFLSVSNHNCVTNGPDGKPEQISVAVASQETYMSEPTAHGRQGGMFWYAQWRTAFEHHPKVVNLTWWNEWTAQRFEFNGNPHSFVDNYTQEYSRDIEPMEGGHGDQYYRWLIEYISAYKAGKDCPVLVEEDYLEDLPTFLKKFERQGRR